MEVKAGKALLEIETFQNDEILNSVVLHLYVPKSMVSKYTREKLAKLAKDRQIYNHIGGFLVQFTNWWSKQRITEGIVVQSLSCVCLFATPWIASHHASLSFTISQSLLKLMSIESMMLTLCHPLLLLPLIFPSIRIFSKESVLCIARVLEYQLQHQSV